MPSNSKKPIGLACASPSLLFRTIVALGFAMFVAVTEGMAQEAKNTTAVAYPVDVPMPWPTTHSDMLRYDRPEMCFSALGRVERAALRRARQDTMAYDPDGSPPKALVDGARRCLARWPIAGLDSAALTFMRTMALLAHSDSIAMQITARQLATIQRQGFPPAVQLRFLGGVTDQLLSIQPARLAMAATIARQVDSITNAGGPHDFETLLAQMNYYGTYGKYAYNLVDLSLLEMIGRRRLEIGTEMSRVAKTDRNREAASIGMLGGINVLGVVHRLRMPTSATPQQVAQSVIAGTPALAAGTAEAIVLGAFAAMGPLFGKPAPPLRSVYAFPSTTGPLPAPHTMSMLAFVSASCDVQCTGLYAMLRRIQRRFPSLAVTLVAHVQGQLRNQPPEPAAVEVQQIRAFFMDSLKLAPQLVIDTAPHTKLAPPDRRYIASLFPTVDAYLPGLRAALLQGQNALDIEGGDKKGVSWGWAFSAMRSPGGRTMGVVLIDDRGLVQYLDVVTQLDERKLTTYVTHMIEGPLPAVTQAHP